MKKIILITLFISCILLPMKVKANEIPKNETQKALEYLLSKQNSDGSMANPLLTDWTIMAIVAAGYDPETFKKDGASIANYEKLSFLPDEDSISSDLSRHILALTSANIDRTTYLDQLLIQYNNSQCGNTDLINDDMFCLLALSSNYKEEYLPYIKLSLKYILKYQNKDDGGFSWDIKSSSDTSITSAAIQALTFSRQYLPELDTEISQAFLESKKYLVNNQAEDGGFGYLPYSDTDTTSWAIPGIYSINENPEDWVKNNQNPINYLLSNQLENGSINSFWDNTTAFTVIALNKKTLPIIPNAELLPFTKTTTEPKPKIEEKIADPIVYPTQTPQSIPQQDIKTEPLEEKAQKPSPVFIDDYQNSNFEILSPTPINDQPELTNNQPERRYIPQSKPQVKGESTSNRKNFSLIVFFVSLILIIVQIFRIKNTKRG